MSVYRYFVVLMVSATAWAAVPLNPTIGSLKKALGQDRSGAIELFWADVSRMGGTPVVECPPALTPDCLVTFLWRGDASTTNVVILAEALPGKPAQHLFRQVPGAGVWYRTYRFRNDARFMYMLSINDPLTSWDVEGAERRKRYAGVRTDPLNQRSGSYVSLPKAPSERWVEEQSGIAHGEVRPYSFRSAALSGERNVAVYQTPGFVPAENDATPALILFDGDESRNLLKVPIVLDNLFAEKRIRPMIAVFLSQPYERREMDLECNESTNVYLVNELLPWLRPQYRIRTEAKQTIVAGSSMGGLAAAFAGLRHPEAIGRVLSQSGAFWWGKNELQGRMAHLEIHFHAPGAGEVLPRCRPHGDKGGSELTAQDQSPAEHGPSLEGV